MYGFGVIPTLELIFPASVHNLNKESKIKALDEPLFDWVLYLSVPIVLGLSVYFLISMGEIPLWTMTWWGRVFSMGLIYGVLAINVAHELGHRLRKGERFLAKILLAHSQYMHFYIEHNRGHHKNVGTPKDPSTSRFNEMLPVFWVRAVFTGYMSSWNLERDRLVKNGNSPWGLNNQMILFTCIQVSVIALVFSVFGQMVLVAYMFSAVLGILLLETVNYIEHYGLTRQKISDHTYERPTPIHSWNSNHRVGRLTLFELSRHSDHHSRANKKYQVLDHHDNSPQMPTGYPGMMLLSAIPPLWFAIMNPRLKKYKDSL